MGSLGSLGCFKTSAIGKLRKWEFGMEFHIKYEFAQISFPNILYINVGNGTI